MTRRSYKFRLYPTKAQTKQVEQTFDLCRELYNACIQERSEAWKRNKVSIKKYDQIKLLPEIKSDRPEFKEIYAQVLQNVPDRVDKAFKGFFRRVKSGQTPGYPRYQNRSRYNSFTYPQAEDLRFDLKSVV